MILFFGILQCIWFASWSVREINGQSVGIADFVDLTPEPSRFPEPARTIISYLI
jgi:hypothetical protein